MSNPLKYNISSRFRLKLIGELIRPNNNKSLLDLGCGIGFMTSFFSRKCKVYGVDISYNSLKLALDNDKRTSFINADALLTPFKDNSFDYVISSEVIEHIEDGCSFVKELKRITKYNGIILLSTPSVDGILKVSKRCHEHGSEYHYKIGYSKNELLSIFQKNGLGLLKVRYNMNFFTQLFMEFTKLFYSIKNPKFEDQADFYKEKDSVFFKIYRKLFFIAILLMRIDLKLERLIKGSNILIVAKKE